MKNNGLLTGVVMVLVFVAGFFLGRFTDGGGTAALPLSGSGGTPTEQSEEASRAQDAQDGTDTEATTVDASSLPAGQRAMLEALGIDANSITITPEMVACAEAKLGAPRLAEIQNGATPSFMEGTALVGCYTSG